MHWLPRDSLDNRSLRIIVDLKFCRYEKAARASILEGNVFVQAGLVVAQNDGRNWMVLDVDVEPPTSALDTSSELLPSLAVAWTQRAVQDRASRIEGCLNMPRGRVP